MDDEQCGSRVWWRGAVPTWLPRHLRTRTRVIWALELPALTIKTQKLTSQRIERSNLEMLLFEFARIAGEGITDRMRPLRLDRSHVDYFC
jgi:hypothetical protein